MNRKIKIFGYPVNYGFEVEEDMGSNSSSSFSGSFILFYSSRGFSKLLSQLNTFSNSFSSPTITATNVDLMYLLIDFCVSNQGGIPGGIRRKYVCQGK